MQFSFFLIRRSHKLLVDGFLSFKEYCPYLIRAILSARRSWRDSDCNEDTSVATVCRALDCFECQMLLNFR